MPRVSTYFSSMNRGEVSRRALGRVDVDKLRMAAEKQINIQPLAMGPGTFRPGTQYLGDTKSDNPARLLEFVFGATDTSLIELTNATMRVWTNDALVSRVAVGSTIQAFASWTLTASTAATVSTGGGKLTISGVTRGQVSYAIGTMTIPGGDTAKEHALRVVVSKGPVKFRIGSTSGGEEIFSEATLDDGTHSLAFTPGVTTAYVRISAQGLPSRVVDSVSVEGAGTLELTTPWLTADLPSLTYDQSADIVFIAQPNYQQYKIERHREGGSNNSWSLVKYKTLDGPFSAGETNPQITMTASAVGGDITITASANYFDTGHVGSLIRLFHNTQLVTESLNTNDTFTDAIRISGGSGTNERNITLTISGTWSGTVTLQRTFDPSGLSGWTDYATYTTNQAGINIYDGYDNVIIWYRIGFKASQYFDRGGSPVHSGGYTSGTAVCQLVNTGGGGAGVARIYAFTNATTVSAEVLTAFKNADKTTDWRISDWNADSKSYPSAVALHEGRLWWAGGGKLWGSVSDAYSSYDFEKIGDAAPIQRTIGKGPIANIKWLLSLSRLAVGADSGIITARSNSFDDPLTPTAFNLKYSTTQGAVSNVRAIAIDTKGVFIDRSGRRVYGVLFTSERFDYKLLDLTRLNLDIGVPGFLDIAVQRQPDTHVRLPLADGRMACFLFDENDELDAWWRVETDGYIENVAVLPGSLEDRVYVVVKRTINGVTKRYVEKFARLDECVGGTVSKLADCHISYSGGSATTITGLSHLEGKSVIVWYNGAEVGFDPNNPSTIATYTVTSGQIALPTAINAGAIIGLPYTGTFVSAKLAYAAAEGTAINQQKRISHFGCILDNTHYQGIRFGHWHEDPADSQLRSMPLIEGGKATATGKVWSSYDNQMIPFPGKWDSDARAQIEMRAPRPATVVGFTLELEVSG